MENKLDKNHGKQDILEDITYTVTYNCVSDWINKRGLCSMQSTSSVIGSFVRMFIRRYIIAGQCAEYNLGGNLIQPNFRTNCTNFPMACPKSYPSTNAFKCE